MLRFAVIVGLVLVHVAPARADGRLPAGLALIDTTDYLTVRGGGLARAGTELRVLGAGPIGACVRIESPLAPPGESMARTLLGLALGVTTGWSLVGALGQHGQLGMSAFGRFGRPMADQPGRIELVLGAHLDFRVLRRIVGIGLEVAASPISPFGWPTLGLVLHLPVLVPAGFS